MLVHNKSSSYREIVTHKRELYAPYRPLCVILKNMKKLLLLSFAIIFIGCVEKKENDLLEKGLNGEVKMISELNYKAIEKFGSPVKENLDTKWTYTFDEKGNEIEQNKFNKSEELVKKTASNYDKNGNLIDKIEYKANGDLKRKYTYKHDVNENIIEVNEYNANNKLSLKDIYNYDEEGNEIEHYVYWSNGDLRIKWTSKYDEIGNKIESLEHSGSGTINERNAYMYDNNRNLVERNLYDAYNVIENGSVSYGGEILEYKWIFKYNTMGHLIEETIYNSNDILQFMRIFKYEFDEKENWIVKTEFKGSEEGKIKATEIIERELEYYN